MSEGIWSKFGIKGGTKKLLFYLKILTSLHLKKLENQEIGGQKNIQDMKFEVTVGLVSI